MRSRCEASPCVTSSLSPFEDPASHSELPRAPDACDASRAATCRTSAILLGEIVARTISAIADACFALRLEA